jgi:hypothetical protein
MVGYVSNYLLEKFPFRHQRQYHLVKANSRQLPRSALAYKQASHNPNDNEVLEAHQPIGCKYLVDSERMTSSVIELPKHINNEVAVLKFKSIEVSYDSLLAKQEKLYINAWSEGIE